MASSNEAVGIISSQISGTIRSVDDAPRVSDVSQTRRGARILLLEEVVVTGIGVILPNCDDREQLWQQLSRGESQLQVDTSGSDGEPMVVGRVSDFDCARYLQGKNPRHYGSCHREQQFYLASVAQAARDAGMDLADLAGQPYGLFDGTSRSCFAYWYELISKKLSQGARFSLKELSPGMPGQAVGLAAAVFGLTGPSFTFNATCASGAVAIGHAFRELQAGRIDVAFATGHDAALVAPIFEMYRDANLLSAEVDEPSGAIAPYTGHHGNAFGEGAVTLVLETRDHARRRGAEILAEITAFRHENGGAHPTDVDFIGDRPVHVIQEVLKEAQSDATDIDFVLGHGNGVRASDISELNYMKRVFGHRASRVPLVSTKPIYGHTLGASSALNVAAAALMLDRGYVIPTAGLDERRVVHGFNHQANLGVERPLRSGLVVSYGIGGQNVVLSLKKAGT